MAVDLKDKVILITGASSGFGANAAELFAKEGAAVVLAARRINRLQDLAARIQAQGGEALAVPVDVSERADVENLVQTVLEIYDRIDILFNNAGFGRLDFLENLSTGRDIEMQVAINLTGTILVTRAVLPHMIQRRQGHIINMSSVAGFIAAPSYTVYAATKFGLRGFTEALRREVSPFGIKVSGIYPGPAATEFGDHTGGAAFKKDFKIPAWTSMSSEDVARTVVQVAKRPRRSVILPWWFVPIIWVNKILPGVVDWVIVQNFTEKYHVPDAPPRDISTENTQVSSTKKDAPTVPPES
jgi:NADP-dependent 3-hydroxy acid dehydrogenase YdfG